MSKLIKQLDAIADALGKVEHQAGKFTRLSINKDGNGFVFIGDQENRFEGTDQCNEILKGDK